jgi:hypothetical protein
MKTRKIAFIGIVGLPASYGGFETFVENLVKFSADSFSSRLSITVFCSTYSYKLRPKYFGSALLHYIPIKANGISSIFYDIIATVIAVFNSHTHLCFLGTSGAIAIPFIRLFTNITVISNIDGLEWNRNKWNYFAKKSLKIFELIAVRYSHFVIADNKSISDYIKSYYKKDSFFIPYGGDHSIKINTEIVSTPKYYKGDYYLSLCRIEPENNVRTILDSFVDARENLVFVGNWDHSNYGRSLKKRYSHYKNIKILDPVYDVSLLYQLRHNTKCYIHGHSAGGTNPSLVEMMFFGVNIFCYDCSFNRNTTHNYSYFFSDTNTLAKLIKQNPSSYGKDLLEVASQHYTWDRVCNSFFSLLNLKT